MRVLLVDGTNVVIRYAHAMLPVEMASRGESVKIRTEDVQRVVVAVERAMYEAAEFTKSTHAIVAVDSLAEPSWRKAVYPDYKCTRTTITGAWSLKLSQYLGSRGWFGLTAPSYEADDILATMAARLGVAGKSAVILSGDSDLLALVNPDTDCRVIQFGSKAAGEGRFVERPFSYVLDRYGVAPRDLRFWKALVGEPGDDLPGVKGIGKKKAAAILRYAMTDSGVDLPTLRGLMPSHGGGALETFDQMLAVVTLNSKVPFGQIAPSSITIPPKP